MSSKYIFIFLFVLGACGVKGDPKPPEASKLPSILEDYPDVKTENKLNETKQP